MKDEETIVKLALNVEPFHKALFKETLEENGIDCFVTGGNSGYGSQGLMYLGTKGLGTYTISVRKSDKEDAIAVLKELGYSVFNEDAEELRFLTLLASPTEKIPYISKYSLYVRLGIMAVAITAINLSSG